jgi:hypothetical protein
MAIRSSKEVIERVLNCDLPEIDLDELDNGETVEGLCDDTVAQAYEGGRAVVVMDLLPRGNDWGGYVIYGANDIGGWMRYDESTQEVCNVPSGTHYFGSVDEMIESINSHLEEADHSEYQV